AAGAGAVGGGGTRPAGTASVASPKGSASRRRRLGRGRIMAYSLRGWEGWPILRERRKPAGKPARCIGVKRRADAAPAGASPWLGTGGRPGAAVVESMESRVSVHEEPREPAWSSPPEQEPAGVPHPSLELPAGASNFRFP